jgi:glycosyltransferase involved in cell wall biosynthesis
VSICIATYNGEKYLYETLQTISRQTYRNTEIIIADDASRDSTYEMVSDWGQTASCSVRLLQSEGNEGPGAAYSKAMTVASGAYLMMFSQDDLMAPNHVESVLRRAHQYPEAVVVPTRLTNLLWSPKLPHTTAKDTWTFFLRMILRNQIGAPGTLFKRSVWRPEFFGKGNLLTQDQEMWLNLSLVGTVAPPAGRVRYRLHENNLHRSQDELARQLDVGLMFRRVLGGDLLTDALSRQPEAARNQLSRNIETAFMSSSAGAPVVRVLNEGLFPKCRMALDAMPSANNLRTIADDVLSAYGDGHDWTSSKRGEVLANLREKLTSNPSFGHKSIIPLLNEYQSVARADNVRRMKNRTTLAKLLGLVRRRALALRISRSWRYEARSALFGLRANPDLNYPWNNCQQEPG